MPSTYIHDVQPWRYVAVDKGSSIMTHLRDRDINGSLRSNRRRAPASWSSSLLPSLLREQEHLFPDMDKIFASRWLSSNEVVMGSKDCKLRILNVDTNKRFEIPLLTDPRASPSSSSSVSSDVASKPLTANQEHQERQLHHQDPGANCAGVRSIAINPSKTLLAIGMGKPEGGAVPITVYRLPTFEPCALLTGHADTVFATEWLDNDRLISGGRDRTVKVWDARSEVLSEFETVFDHQRISIHGPVMNKDDGRGRVRDLKYNACVGQAVTLSTEGYVRAWNVSTVQPISTIPLKHAQEAVCLASSCDFANLYAVGSQSHVSLIDPRVHDDSIVHVAKSLDDGWGVRSLSIDNHVVTVGGGLGRISFYDLRAQDYIICDGIASSSDSAAKSLEIGTGWLHQNGVYMQHFAGLPVRNAIYTLGYDDEHMKLFAAGGPLQLGLCGSYTGLWW